MRRRTAAGLVLMAVAIAASGCTIGYVESPATNVTDTTATLNGKVASNRSEDGVYWFEYGPTTAYGTSTPERAISFTSYVKKPVSEQVTGLAPWTDYHYRVCAKDRDPEAGPGCSKDATFTTGDPQVTLGPDRPRYTLHIDATDGTSDNPQSGVEHVTVHVDNEQVVDNHSGCVSENCSVSDDWTLYADEYEPGHHTLTVEATDAVGRVTSRQLDLEIQPDTTDPHLKVTGPLKSAPEGWVDQRNYTVTGDARDSGYGITSLKLLIDDQQVGQAASQTCPDGACPLQHTFNVDTANYDGGAHQVELVATDGAGNTKTTDWTMNVNPDGNISAGEASATAEAAGETSGTPAVDLVASDDYPGTSPDVQLQQDGSTIESVGGATPTTMTTDPSDGVTSVVPNPDALSGTMDEVSVIPHTITVAPAETDPAATDMAVTSNGAAAVSANTDNQVDTLTRPLYDGAMIFEVIRDRSAPETSSWRVDMEDGDTLKQIDATTAQVAYPDGTPAVTIVAVAAHDATGAVVPTTLKVDGPNGFTLTVSHQAGSYVYPVLAGPGWENAYIAPWYARPPTGTPDESGDTYPGDAVFSAPTPDTSDPAYRAAPCNSGARPNKCPKIRRYNFTDCLTMRGAEGIPPIGRPTTGCNDPDYPETGIGSTNALRLPVFGHFHYLYGEWVKVKPGEFHCEPRGSQARNAASVGCPIGNYKVGSQGNYYQDGGRKLWMFGYFIYGPGFGHECEKIVGYLPSRPGVDSGPFPGFAQRKWADRWKWLARGVPLGQPVSQMPLGDLQEYCGFTKTLKADSGLGDIGPF